MKRLSSFENQTRNIKKPTPGMPIKLPLNFRVVGGKHATRSSQVSVPPTRSRSVCSHGQERAQSDFFLNPLSQGLQYVIKGLSKVTSIVFNFLGIELWQEAGQPERGKTSVPSVCQGQGAAAPMVEGEPALRARPLRLLSSPSCARSPVPVAMTPRGWRVSRRWR